MNCRTIWLWTKFVVTTGMVIELCYALLVDPHFMGFVTGTRFEVWAYILVMAWIAVELGKRLFWKRYNDPA